MAAISPRTPEASRFATARRPDVEYLFSPALRSRRSAALSRLVGPPPLPPQSTLGFLNSQWGSTQAGVEKIVARYRKDKSPSTDSFSTLAGRRGARTTTANGDGTRPPGPATSLLINSLTVRAVHSRATLPLKACKLAGILKPRILTTVAGDTNHATEAAAYATDHNISYPSEDPSPDYFSHRPARILELQQS